MARIDIDGALALVTGAGSGIGEQTAIALASRGARVLCTGRNAEAAEKTAATCREAGPQAASYRLDVTDRRGMKCSPRRSPPSTATSTLTTPASA